MSVNGKMTVDVSQLCRQPSKMVHEAQVGPIVILRRNKPVACLVSFEEWEAMTKHMQDADKPSAAPADPPAMDPTKAILNG